MATTPRLKLPYPNENSDPWFESFEAFAESLDAALYAAREDRNTVLMGGGTLTFTASSNSLTWGANIEFFSPVTGYLWRIAGPGNVTLADGDVAYVTVTRAPQQVTVVTLAVDTKVPTEPDGDNTLLFAIRRGSRVYFRNGAVINDGDSAAVFQTGGGGASPGGSDDEIQVKNGAALAGATNVKAGNGFISIGASPALSGVLRLEDGFGITQRHPDGLLDVGVLQSYVYVGPTQTELAIGTYDDGDPTKTYDRLSVCANNLVYFWMNNSEVPFQVGRTADGIWGAFLPSGYNFALCGSRSAFVGADFGSGLGVMYLGNAATVPTTNPTGGIVLYANGDVFGYRKPSGAVVSLDGSTPKRVVSLSAGNFSEANGVFQKVGGLSLDLADYPATVNGLTRSIRFAADVQKTAGATSVEVKVVDHNHADVTITGTSLTHAADTAPTRVLSAALTVGTSNGDLRTDSTCQYGVYLKMNGGALGADSVFLFNARFEITYS